MRGNRFAAAAFGVLLTLLVCCSCGAGAKRGAASVVPDAAETAWHETAERLGEGARQFYFSVTFSDGAVKAYDIATDETTVGAALAALGLVEGERSDYGLYVKTIGGERADYTLDGAYWAFYINGAYAMTGVDGAEIEDGGDYAFVYTPADGG